MEGLWALICAGLLWMVVGSVQATPVCFEPPSFTGKTVHIPCGSNLQEVIKNANVGDTLVFEGRGDNTDRVARTLRKAFPKEEFCSAPPASDSCCWFETDKTIFLNRKIRLEGLCLRLKDALSGKLPLMEIRADGAALGRFRFFGPLLFPPQFRRRSRVEASLSITASNVNVYHGVIERSFGAGIIVRSTLSKPISNVKINWIVGKENQDSLVYVLGRKFGRILTKNIKMNYLVQEMSIEGGALRLRDGVDLIDARKLMAYDSFATVRITENDDPRPQPAPTKARVLLKDIFAENSEWGLHSKHGDWYSFDVEGLFATNCTGVVHSRVRDELVLRHVVVRDSRGFGDLFSLTTSRWMYLSGIRFFGGTANAAFKFEGLTFNDVGGQLHIANTKVRMDSFVHGVIFSHRRPEGKNLHLVDVDFSNASEEEIIIGG